MSERKKYLPDLKEGNYPWENLFVAACVEHVLPPVGRKWPTLVQDLAQATALVKSTQSTDDQYGDRLEELGQILAKFLATDSGKGNAANRGDPASSVVVAAASLADSKKDEQAWQEQQFQQYKNGNLPPWA